MGKPDEPPPSLDALQQKLDQATPSSEKKPEGPATRSGNAMRLGTDLLAGVGVGGMIGYWADRAFGTSPILFIVFFFLGFAAGVRNILRGIDKEADL